MKYKPEQKEFLPQIEIKIKIQVCIFGEKIKNIMFNTENLTSKVYFWSFLLSEMSRKENSNQNRKFLDKRFCSSFSTLFSKKTFFHSLSPPIKKFTR